MGLFDYPVLQAADILIMKGTSVPVGIDQVQHIELTRDIARFFNRKFGNTFGEPKPLLTSAARVMALTDPSKKMSKSLPGSFISLADSPEEVQKKVRGAITDTLQGGEMSPGVTNLMVLLKEFGSASDVKKFESAFKEGSIKYVELKDLVALRIGEHFASFREKRAKLLKSPSKIKSVLKAGGAKVKALAKKTMDEVRKKTGLR
jgi:tryptophanyl-tRNA synthetase